MEIDWIKYDKLYGVCENCDKEIDFDYKIEILNTIPIVFKYKIYYNQIQKKN